MAKQRASKRKSSKSSRDKKSFLHSTGAFSTNPHAAKAPSPEPSPPGPTTPELIASAASLLHEQNNPLEALTLITHALSLSPIDLKALELLGEVHIELGDEDTARQAFEKAAELDPNGEGSGPEKFLWLAQLGQGGEAMMKWYMRGVEVLRQWIREGKGNGKPESKGKGKQVTVEDEDDEDRGLEGKLCSALCAMSEIYMSDLCMEPDAESRCETYITEALLVDPSSSDALQTLASIRISQQRIPDAIAALNRSFGLWKDLDPMDDKVPSYSCRVNLVKLLIETEQYDDAVEILERLLQEDDQLPDLWYLGGWCFYLLGQRLEEGTAERTEMWEGAREWLVNCETLYTALEWEDEGIKEHVIELLATLNAVLPELMEDEEDDGSEEGDEEWEDDEDEEMAE